MVASQEIRLPAVTSSLQLTLPDIKRLHLEELVNRGYGHDSSDPERIAQQMQIEYEPGNPNRSIFVITEPKEGFAIATHCIDDWDREHSVLGSIFWKELTERVPQLQDRVLTICEVNGFVVHPDYRSHGLAEILLTAVQKECNPDIVIGESKNPAAVLMRDRGYASYHTFYGRTSVRVTSHSDATYAFLESLYTAYYATRIKDSVPNQEWVSLLPTYYLTPKIPDTSKLPNHLQNQFSQLITVQEGIGDSYTAVLPMVSIHPRVLEIIS